MRFIKRIKDKIVQKNKEIKEQEKREEELAKIVENLRNIDLFGKKQENKKINIIEEEPENYLLKKQREEDLVRTVENLKNIKLPHGNYERKNNENNTNLQISSKKIDVISRINIESMNNTQLQTTYKCVKKSIEEAKQKGKTEQLNELIKLKKKIKDKLIQENNDLNLQSIKCNLMLGNIEKIDLYENVLIGLYNELENNKFKGYDSDIQQMKIHILALIKLISKIKKSDKTYTKKIA